mgnify:FL=1
MMLSAAAIAAVACAKETVVKPEGEEPAGEGVTFTAFMQSENPTDAAAETKVAIDIDATAKTAKVSFTAGDFIAVYDGETIDRITLNAENINPDGSATFTAKNVSPTAESYLAYVSDKNTLGSFEANHVYTNVKNDANPNDFVEIASGRIPHAAFASCSGTDRRLSFKNMLTLLKFKVSTTGVSYVEFKGNNNENVTGKVVGTYSTGETKLVEFNTETNCFAAAKTFVSAPDTDCYITLAPGLTLSKGFTITAYDKAGNSLFTSKSDKAFKTTAGKLWDLGTLEEHKMTPYQMWMAGQDIEIGGKMYNKAEYGDGKLISEGTAAVATPGVYFIAPGAEVSLNQCVFKGSVMLIGNESGTRSSVHIINGCDYELGSESAEHHVVAFKNVSITNDNLNRRILSVASANIGRIVLENCYLGLNEDLIWRQKAGQNLNDMSIIDCDIRVMNDKDSRGRALIQTWNGAAADYTLGSFTAKNNVIWSDGEPRPFYFIDARFASGIEFAAVDIENNTLYNVAGVDTGSRRGLVTVNKISGDVTIKNNIAYQTNPVDKGTAGESKLLILSTKGEDREITSVNTGGNWSWYPHTTFMVGIKNAFYWGSAEGTSLGMKLNGNAIDSINEPFESVNLTTGSFVKKAAFAATGASR